MTPKNNPLVLAKPPKKIADMTEEEVHAWAVQIFNALGPPRQVDQTPPQEP